MRAGEVIRSTADPAAEGLSALELGKEAGAAEYRLWCAALDMLIKDGQSYWKCQKWREADSVEQEQAFDDLLRCGPMTRHCCRWLDLDPQWISEGFIRWCESMA